MGGYFIARIGITTMPSPADCEIWDVIVGAGYAVAGKKDRYGGRMYWLNRNGLDWLGEKLGINIWDEEE